MRPYNFSPGPATIPQTVLEQAAAEMLDWNGSGMCVMEMSHRGAEYTQIFERTMRDFRELMNVPESHEVLFMQGGAIAENAIVPMNLSHRDGKGGKVDFVLTGIWSEKSAKEAAKYCDVHIAAKPEGGTYTGIPSQATWNLRKDAKYLHLCTNETIHGVEFHALPEVATPIVADVSSHILSRPLEVSKYACLFGGAQKNIGMPGLTIVIVRKDWIGHALPFCPSAFDYKNVADNGSMFNTPPTYAIYIAGLVFQWLKREGGAAEMERRNIAKAKLLYDFIDSSSFYVNHVEKQSRSRMNVTYFLRDESLNARFVSESKAAGLLALKGHKLVGGMRASIYNAMPIEGVQKLVSFMKEFERVA